MLDVSFKSERNKSSFSLLTAFILFGQMGLNCIWNRVFGFCAVGSDSQKTILYKCFNNLVKNEIFKKVEALMLKLFS